MNTQASFATTPSERLKKISTLSQTILRASPLTRTLAIAIGSLMLSAPAWTQQAAADQEASAVPKATSVEPMALTIDDAVTSALAKDPGVISANLDWLSDREGGLRLLEEAPLIVRQRGLYATK